MTILATRDVQDVYIQHIKSLSYEQRLRLLSLIAQDLLGEPSLTLPVQQPTYSIMELHGLGKEIWEGVEVQEYVNKLRDEWNDRI